MQTDTQAELRRQKRKQRDAFFRESPAEFAARCQKARQNLFSLPCLAEAETVFVYKSFASELATDGVIERLLATGKRVLLPRTAGETMVAVEYRGGPLLKNQWGIPEPGGPDYGGKIDVCILPLVACDRFGARIGYGKGFYDRYLATHQIGRKVAYCFDFQICNGVILQKETDVSADTVVTDEKIIIIR